MCYEFSSWHWKARAKALHQAQVKADAEAQKAMPAQPAIVTERKQPEVKEAEKIPA